MPLNDKNKEKASFDNEVSNWSSLYEDEPDCKASWGIFQKSVQKTSQRRLEICLSMVSRYQPKKVLDVGCGSGSYGVRLLQKGLHWCGLDISTPMLRHCKEVFSGLGKIPPLISGSFLHLPIRPNYFDMVLNIGVLSYYRKNDVEKALEEFSHVLKPSGILITQSIPFNIITWVRSRLPLFFPRPLRVPGPLYPYRPKFIKEILQQKGFSIVDTVLLSKFGIIPVAWIYVAKKS